MDAIRKDKNILIVGEKLRETSELLGMLFARVDPPIHCRFFYLAEEKFRYEALDVYMSFDVVMCPWRWCLLDLALERQGKQGKPYLLLVTGGPQDESLAWGGICDECISPLGVYPWAKRVIAAGRLPNFTDAEQSRMTALSENGLSGDKAVKSAIVSFVAYLRRDAHGEIPVWAKLPIDQAYVEAERKYAMLTRRSLKEQGCMIIKPSFPPVDTAMPSSELKSCFVIMPFDADLSSIYKDIIKPTVESCGIEIHRADDFFTVGHIISDIWQRIVEADFLIADLTGRNPNVYYELGIAHTIGKPVILVVQRIEDVPFDIHHQRVILYGPRYDQIEKFRKDLEQSIAEIRADRLKQVGI